MMFRSVLKLLVVASALCSLSAFAAGIFSELSSGGDGRTYVSYFKGKGTMIYKNALIYKKAGNWKLLSTISVGNADGVVYVSAQELEQVIERRPENN